MLAARAQHVAEVIEPALARGDDVVCDRYSGSTFAYQGYGRGLDLGEIADLDRWASGGGPDIVVLLDMPAERAQARRAGTAPDRIEAQGARFLAARPGRVQGAGGDGPRALEGRRRLGRCGRGRGRREGGRRVTGAS